MSVKVEMIDVGIATDAIKVLRQSRMKSSTVSATRIAPKMRCRCTSSIVRLMKRD